jgi:methionyl-tRNA formyltransferase
MMGSGPYAAPTLRSLLASRHEVAALVTQPLREGAARRPLPPSPMRVVATEHGLPILDPQSINTPEARTALAQLGADLMVVCDYGQILSPETLQVARLGGINLHASLLPKYRGAAPINWAIYHGDTVTGNTVLHITPSVDAGPCIARQKVAIDPDENAVELEARLAAMGAELVLSSIDALESGHAAPLPQDPAQATRARRLRKSDGQVDWTRTAEQICNQIRAFVPWPKTYTNLTREGREPQRLILDAAHVEPGGTSGGVPGTVIASAGSQLAISTGAGLLTIDRVQPAGKRSMYIAEFLRGHPIRPGDRFA